MPGSRDPLGGQSIGSGGYDLTGGPFGYLKALALFVAVVVALVGTVWGLEGVLNAFVPAWAVLPLVIVAVAILVVAGLSVVLRANEALSR
jgi:divalent metal cation (Fe/Co/Zn/Cd) transporter